MEILAIALTKSFYYNVGVHVQCMVLSIKEKYYGYSNKGYNYRKSFNN